VDAPIGPRVVVVGTSGVGKTTFAARLAATRGWPHVELDAFMHEPGWIEAAPDVFRARVEAATTGRHWVVDGNYELARDIVWTRATTLVWLDYSRPRTMARVIRRSVWRAVTRTELWNGNREDWRQWADPEHPIRWAWTKHPERRQRYPALLAEPDWAHLRVHRLRRSRDSRRLLREVAARMVCRMVCAMVCPMVCPMV
jgi:adenylate kinase family enzyme